MYLPSLLYSTSAVRPPLSLAFESAGDQHPAGEREERVRADDPAGVLHEGVDGAYQLRLRRIGGDVEDPDLAVVEAPGPEVAPVVAEAGVMGLVPAAHRRRRHHLPVRRRARGRADGHQLVGAVAHALDAERPGVDVVLLTSDLGQVRRHACLVGTGRLDGSQQQDRDGDGSSSDHRHHLRDDV